MRKIPKKMAWFLFGICVSCGPDMMNMRNPNLQDKGTGSNALPQVDKELEMEKTLTLMQDLDLATLAFQSVGKTTAASLDSYMEEKGLKAALLVFCEEDTASCRMINRDLAAEPIGTDSEKFQVVGVLVNEAKEPEELPDFFQFDDHLDQFLDHELMEAPESDIVPYFALMFRGKSKQGIVSRWPLDKINHQELKSSVEEFLQKIGGVL